MSMRKIEVLTIILRGRIVNISYYLTLPLSIPAESIAFAPVRLAWQKPEPREAKPGKAIKQGGGAKLGRKEIQAKPGCRAVQS